MKMDEESLAEATLIANNLNVTTDVVLEAFQESVREAYTQLEAERLGSFVYLTEEAAAIWDEAVKQAFERWLEREAHE